MEANLTEFLWSPVYISSTIFCTLENTLELNLMYVYKNKSTNWNYIWCFVSGSQVAKDLGESTNIYKVESYLYKWYFYFMLQFDRDVFLHEFTSMTYYLFSRIFACI